MKKLWLLAAVALPIAILTGCGSDDAGGVNPAPGPEDQQKTETPNSTEISVNGSGSEVAEFNEQPGITVIGDAIGRGNTGGGTGGSLGPNVGKRQTQQ
jgi:hypothetical protein